MASTIISVHAPAHIVNLPHNSVFRINEELVYNDDVFAVGSLSEKSDNGTPAPTSCPSDATLSLTTRHFPKDPRLGFVFGTDTSTCDILLPSAPEFAISKRQFAVTFKVNTGAVILRNLSRQQTRITTNNDLMNIELKTQRVICKEGIDVQLSGLHLRLVRPWEDDNISKDYGSFLLKLANAIPNLGAMRLVSETQSTSRLTSTRGKSVYGSEVYVGSGATAMVYRATHERTGDFVAIKRYTRKSYELPWNEIKIITTLKHRHIIAFHQFNICDGESAELYMEYADLGSLTNQNKAAKFTVDETCTILEHTLKALQYLHDRGITHRDIKPDNILIMSRKPIYAKVADFGVSSEASHHKTFCGTRRYAAPEIYRPPYTAKVDIWSVGVMAMELWLGLPARGDDSWAERIVAHREKQTSSVAAELLDSCLQLDPKNRATAEECLKLPLFRSQSHTQTDEVQNISLSENRADVYNCETMRLESSIPNTELWNPEAIEAFHLQEQVEEEPTVSNFDRFGEGLGAIQPQDEERCPSNAVAIDLETASRCERSQQAAAVHGCINIKGTTYHFFDWRKKRIAYIPDRSMVNVTNILAVVGLVFSQVRDKDFLALTKNKKHVIRLGPKTLSGTYMLYADALSAFNHLRIDTSGLPHFLLQVRYQTVVE